MVKDIRIIAGYNKDGIVEPFDELVFTPGETISIMGSTGSGKTALITDIELLSQGDSVTKRKVLIDGKVPPDEVRYNPAYKPIVMITQNTKCFSDLFVDEFLQIHARARGVNDQSIVNETIFMANMFTGEAIKESNRVTELSGGQTRSLLIADAIKIGNAPIVLLDEIENAGINKAEITRCIRDNNKVIVFVTHDPAIALQTEKRIIMKNGSVSKIIERSDYEIGILQEVLRMDRIMLNLRDLLRAGETFNTDLASLI